MKVNALQQTLLEKYEDGEFAHIKRSEDLRNCGDPLLTFLFYELDDDCYVESRSTGIPVMVIASKRMLKIVEQVNLINTAILVGE